MNNILIHIPHSSYYIPEKYKKLFFLSNKELFGEQLKMSDTYTDELFDIGEIRKIIFPISRLVCDVDILLRHTWRIEQLHRGPKNHRLQGGIV